MWYEEADVKAESKEGEKLEKRDRTREVVWCGGWLREGRADELDMRRTIVRVVVQVCTRRGSGSSVVGRSVNGIHMGERARPWAPKEKQV